MKNYFYCLLILMSLIFVPTKLIAGDKMMSPYTWNKAKVDAISQIDLKNKEDLSPPAVAFHQVIKFYQRYFSGHTGKECPMYPSCSNYSFQVIQKYGFLKGYILTCDRLMRCGHDLESYQLIMADRKNYYFDPVP